MTHRIFIDANHLIRFGHGFIGAEAVALRELIEVGAVKLVTTDLTMREVAKRFAKQDTERLQEICKGDFRAKAKRYLQLELPEIAREDLWRKIFDEHFQAVKDFMREVDAEVLTIDSVSPLIVLEDYTHSRGIFSPSSKKDQFPDAFIFEVLKSSVDERAPIIVLSEDGDFAKACSEAAYIQRAGGFEALLEILGIRSADNAAYELVKRFEGAFAKPVENLLQDYTLIAEDVDDSEIEVISANKVKLELLGVYQLAEQNNAFLVYAKVSCKADVSYSHPDWDSAIWDGEDKVAIPFETVEGEAEVDVDDEACTFAFVYDPEADTAVVSNPSLRGSGLITVELYPRDDLY